MKNIKKAIILLLIICLSTFVSACNSQDTNNTIDTSSKLVTNKDIPTALVKYKGKWGVIDKEENWIVKPNLKFKGVKGFSQGVNSFSEGLAIAQNTDGKWGYINRFGQWEIEPQFSFSYPGPDTRSDFTEGYAAVEIDGKYGFINKSGEIVIEPKYRDITTTFSEGYAVVSEEFEYRLINTKGETVLELEDKNKYYEISSFKEGLLMQENDNLKYGHIDISGNWVIKPIYNYASEFSEGLAFAFSDTKCGYIDHKGEFKIILDNDIEWGFDFKEGLATIANTNDFSGVINTKGELIIPFKYDYICDFNEGIAFFIKDRLYGCLDNNGNELIPAKFEYCEDFKFGLAAAKYNGKWGFINKQGDWVIEPKFYLVTDFIK